MSDWTTLKGLKNPTPLLIIASFVALAEAIAAFALVRTEDTTQIILAVFVVLFPAGVAHGFFSILWDRPWNFYHPKEYPPETPIGEFIEAHRRVAGADRLARQRTSETISEELTGGEFAETIKVLIAGLPEAGRIAAKIGELVSAKTMLAISKNYLNVDVSDLVVDGVPLLAMPYRDGMEISELLQAIYFSIADHVQPYKYGTDWQLLESGSNQALPPIGSQFKGSRGWDTRTLSELGITPDKEYRVVRPN